MICPKRRWSKARTRSRKANWKLEAMVTQEAVSWSEKLWTGGKVDEMLKKSPRAA